MANLSVPATEKLGTTNTIFGRVLFAFRVQNFPGKYHPNAAVSVAWNYADFSLLCRSN
jgi:hypothetical protein